MNQRGLMSDRQLATRTGSLEYDPARNRGHRQTEAELWLFIDGEFSDAASHGQFATINPANE